MKAASAPERLRRFVRADEDQWAKWARIGIWTLLMVSWAIQVAYMWDALTTVPSAERLEETRMAVIPTSRTFFAAMVFSALELSVVLVALWPWRAGYYTARLSGTTLALVTWFIMTTPMDLSRMDWVHRRWLFFLILAVGGALLVSAAYRSIRAVAARERGDGGGQ